MTSKAHPLQEATVHLLNALYKDKHLPVTRAMLSIQNGHYPDLESILDTLHRYAGVELVTDFSTSNGNLIERTKKEIVEQKAEKTEENAHQSDTFTEDSFGSSFTLVHPYELMKSVSLVEIENAFSTELSKLCNQELIVEIESVQSNQKSLDSWAEMKVIVKPKERFTHKPRAHKQ